jgi:NADH-quinone oxidoreductase subunit L
MAAGAVSIDMGFLVDRLTVVMLLVVTGVGSLIHIYSVGYMHGDPRYGRFFAYMNLFAAMMLLLVLGDNYLVLVLGWEGVGLCSYLLIGFWFERPFDGGTTNDAARKAFVVNRIGDFGFVIGIFLLWTTVGGFGFAQAQAAAGSGAIGPAIATAVTLLLFVGATGKSAQIPLYIWLPDAMAGPTPVSALIHAATMVTAGVYMVARNHFLYDLAPFSQDLVVWVGGLTALFAASMAVQQNDIKKILAYSTISQLGYMFMAVGAGAYAAGIMHLTTHAYFKALLFLGAGMAIHALHGEQDITKMGGLKEKLPGVYWTFLMGALALAGIPLTAGFFSKDSILAVVYGHGHFGPWAIGMVTAGVTAFYAFRLVFLAFHGPYRAPVEHPHPPAMSMFVPCAVLAVLSIVGGYVELPMHLFTGFSHFLAPVVGETEVHLSAETELVLMGGTLVLILVGIWGAWSLYGREMTPEKAEQIAAEPSGFMKVLRHKWYVDELYDFVIVSPLKWVSRTVLWRAIDDWVIHGFLVQFCGGLLWKSVGFILSFWHTGRVGSYAFGIVLGALLVLWIMLRV